LALATRRPRHQIRIADGADVLNLERDERLGDARSRDELDFQAVGLVHLNHGAEITLSKPEFRKVSVEHHDIGHFELH
jgi:hypothetical protein